MAWSGKGIGFIIGGVVLGIVAIGIAAAFSYISLQKHKGAKDKAKVPLIVSAIVALFMLVSGILLAISLEESKRPSILIAQLAVIISMLSLALSIMGWLITVTMNSRDLTKLDAEAALEKRL